MVRFWTWEIQVRQSEFALANSRLTHSTKRSDKVKIFFFQQQLRAKRELGESKKFAQCAISPPFEKTKNQGREKYGDRPFFCLAYHAYKLC